MIFYFLCKLIVEINGIHKIFWLQVIGRAKYYYKNLIMLPSSPGL